VTEGVKKEEKQHFSVSMPFSRIIRYVFETIFAYILYGFFWVLPMAWASNLGGFIMRNIGPHLGASRKTLQNISKAYPKETYSHHKNILVGMWDNIGRVIGEFPHIRGVKKGENIEIVGEENIKSFQNGKNPAIFIGGHIGNWEVQTKALSFLGINPLFVYRKPNNPWVDSLLHYAREKTQDDMVAKGHEGARELVSALKKGRPLGMLIDQKLNEGLSIPFFGRPAMTAPAAAKFALKFDCPLMPIRVERIKGSQFRVTFYPPLKINKTKDGKKDIEETLKTINQTLEDWIRERPEQWLWLHKRWS